MLVEVWKIIKDFDNYEVSNFGLVRNIKTGELRRRQETESGYYVYFTKPKHKPKGIAVKYLVAHAFCENANTFEHVTFIDGNKFNPVWTNLRFVSTNRKHNRGKYNIKKKEKSNTFVADLLAMEKKQLDKLNYFKHS